MFGKATEPRGRRRPVANNQQRTPVVQYYRNESIPEQRVERRPEPPRPRGKVAVHAARLPAYLSIAAIVASLIYCSILGNNVTVVVHENALYTNAYYEARVGEQFNASFFNHSKLTLDIRALKSAVMQHIPEVADVSVSVPLVGQKPVIGLSLTPAAYVLQLPNQKSYIIGSNGKVLAETKDVTSADIASLRLIEENIPLAIKPGAIVLSDTDVRFLEALEMSFKKETLTITSFEFPVGAGEVHVHAQELPYTVKFSTSGDVRQQVGAFLAVKNQLSIPPAEYIDARIGERVYVK